MTLDEKLDHFYNSVIEYATRQNLEIIEEYKKSLKKNYEERKEAAQRKADAIYRTAVESITRERNRRLSADAMEMRRKILDKTAEYTKLIFREVRQRLDEYMKTPEYLDLLVELITKAKDFAKRDALTVYINPTDADKKAVLEERTGISLTISDRDFIGGIRAVIPSHKILIDNSFLTKIEDVKSSFTL